MDAKQSLAYQAYVTSFNPRARDGREQIRRHYRGRYSVFQSTRP